MALSVATAGLLAFCRNSSRGRHTWGMSRDQMLKLRVMRHRFRRDVMRRTILTALAVLAIGTASTGIVIAQAQPAPPDMGGTPPHQWMGGKHRGEGQQHGGMMHRLRIFALIYPQKDRKLTPPDVQKI